MRLWLKHEWRNDVLLITPVPLYMVLHILYSNLLLKDPSSWVKTQTCFTIWDFILRNRVKVHYYFATMQLGSIINYKEESLLHFLTLGYKKHCKLHRKSGLTFYLGGWFMKNVTITFSVPKSIYGFPIILSFDVHFNKRRKCWKFAAVLSNYDSAVFQLCFS